MRSRFGLGVVVAFCLILAAPAGAAAHTDLVESSPADGAQLDEPPTEVVLTFESELSDDAIFTVTDAEGNVVGSGTLDLDIADRNVIRGDVSIAQDGVFRVAYSFVGEDGDPIEGEVTFGVGSRPPNTAMAPEAGGFNLTSVGLALFVVAVTLGSRARRSRT